MDEQERMATIKRTKPGRREEQLLQEAPGLHPLVEKSARAISDWITERDWELHTDAAIRCIETVSEQLQREGHDSAANYLRSILWEEPKPRTKEPERYSRLYF